MGFPIEFNRFGHSPIIYFYISERGAGLENVGRWGGTARHFPFRRLNQSIHQKLHQGTRKIPDQFDVLNKYFLTSLYRILYNLLLFICYPINFFF